jgi:hypothetical protein
MAFINSLVFSMPPVESIPCLPIAEVSLIPDKRFALAPY